jgi:hypothetical protein
VRRSVADQVQHLVSGVDPAATLGTSLLVQRVQPLEPKPTLIVAHRELEELAAIAVPEVLDHLVESRAKVVTDGEPEGLPSHHSSSCLRVIASRGQAEAQVRGDLFPRPARIRVDSEVAKTVVKQTPVFINDGRLIAVAHALKVLAGSDVRPEAVDQTAAGNEADFGRPP